MGKGRLKSGNAKLKGIRNKLKRVEVYQKLKKEGEATKRKERKARQKEAEALGEAAPKPPPQKTLDNTREVDDTIVQPDDDEVLGENSFDEFASHFSGERPPRIVVTTSCYPSAKLMDFLEVIVDLFPNCEYRKRGAVPIKEVVAAASKRDFTMLMVFTEKSKQVHGLWMIKLPEGPTARFKLTNVVMPKKLHGHGRKTGHRPELILNNFSTRLGHRVGRFLACLVPHDPQFKGRQVVTMHNQRDFIFFRHHRYVFEEKKAEGKKTEVGAYLQELGPRFTLKLKSLQLGSFDTQHGEYEWKHKPELDTSRRRFHL
ncbi:hypothetical protein AB1Y20_020372 [Prymnesium parvum]|uniref:Brix domain-containing protein n=1 Tax=Prymnesium parvum TaxID=97485 RepID=A0AB34JUG8_PRYPA|mmetsp:Transcript_41648/g.101126  ORF Transcript_41648/g.101126 Transcript_41648/m.101126 type:complete len:315 (+) Transcript_41648:41-985(+)